MPGRLKSIQSYRGIEGATEEARLRLVWGNCPFRRAMTTFRPSYLKFRPLAGILDATYNYAADPVY